MLFIYSCMGERRNNQKKCSTIKTILKMEKETLDANKNNEQKNFAVHDIAGTPFAIVEETESKKCKIVMGNQLLHAGEFPDIEKAKTYIKNKPWELIVNTMFVIANHMFNNQKTE